MNRSSLKGSRESMGEKAVIRIANSDRVLAGSRRAKDFTGTPLIPPFIPPTLYGTAAVRQDEG